MPDSFLEQMRKAAPSRDAVRARKWVYVPYDRLHDGVGTLAAIPPKEAGIVLVESQEKARRRPYHKKKLTVLLANERHFAQEQLARGCAVIYFATRGTIGDGLRKAQSAYGLPELVTNDPAERELRLDLESAIAGGLKLQFAPDTTWLSTPKDFDTVFGKEHPREHYRMDSFYRHMRKKTGILMERGKPVGGKFSLDEENRQAYRGVPPVPERPSYVPDAITREVMELIEREFPDHFGTLAAFNLPVTRAQAEEFWRFCLRALLANFGPYEDAMNAHEPRLFHTQISPLLNLTRVLPADLVRDVAAAYHYGRVPLASAEGFIRQILGWREYMRHIHRVTDGFRKLTSYAARGDASNPGAPNHLRANRKLPAVYWGAESGMRCMDTVVAGVSQDGWSHHITRLMVLSNLATLCGFSPRELADWFWFAYVDAYDWVVEPNVLGMSTYADGGTTATKPYISGAAYINRMSDFCGKCRFDSKKALGADACPFTSLYWTFLDTHKDKLAGNLRLSMPLNALSKKSPQELAALRERAEEAVAALEAQPYPLHPVP